MCVIPPTKNERLDEGEGCEAETRADGGLPQHGLGVVGGSLLDGEEESAHGRAEGGRHPGGGAARHEVPLLLVRPEVAEDLGLDGKQVWSLSRFKMSCQLLMNDLNHVSSVSLLMTASTALANEGLFELTRRLPFTKNTL